MRNRARARAIQQDRRLWDAFLLGGLLAMVIAGAALAQTRTTVIHPPQHVDPNMRVTPPAHPALPTPVVKPPATRDGKVVVPK